MEIGTNVLPLLIRSQAPIIFLIDTQKITHQNPFTQAVSMAETKYTKGERYTKVPFFLVSQPINRTNDSIWLIPLNNPQPRPYI